MRRSHHRNLIGNLAITWLSTAIVTLALFWGAAVSRSDYNPPHPFGGASRVLKKIDFNMNAKGGLKGRFTSPSLPSAMPGLPHQHTKRPRGPGEAYNVYFVCLETAQEALKVDVRRFKTL